MNELVNTIDENIFDNLEVATDSYTANLETPHPCPSCSITWTTTVIMISAHIINKKKIYQRSIFHLNPHHHVFLAA